MGTTVAGLAPGLSRKLKKVLESRIDTPDLLSSLNTLSSFYDENTPQARRNLRSTIEKRSLSINHEFVDASHAAQLVIPLRHLSSFLFSLASAVLIRFGPVPFSLHFCFVRLWIAWRTRSMRLPSAATGAAFCFRAFLSCISLFACLS